MPRKKLSTTTSSQTENAAETDLTTPTPTSPDTAELTKTAKPRASRATKKATVIDPAVASEPVKPARAKRAPKAATKIAEDPEAANTDLIAATESTPTSEDVLAVEPEVGVIEIASEAVEPEADLPAPESLEALVAASGELDEVAEVAAIVEDSEDETPAPRIGGMANRSLTRRPRTKKPPKVAVESESAPEVTKPKSRKKEAIEAKTEEPTQEESKPKRKGRKLAEVAPTPIAESFDDLFPGLEFRRIGSPVADPEAPLFRPSGRIVAAKPEVEAVPFKLENPFADETDSIFTLEWRSNAKTAEPIAEKTERTSEPALRERGPKDRRRRKERGGSSREASDELQEDVAVSLESEIEEPEEIVPSAPPVPVKPPRAVPPETAPRVVLRNGVPVIVRDHRIIPPLMFFGSPSDERRAQNVFEQIRMASESGVHLFSYLIELEVDQTTVETASSFAAYMLAKSKAIDPQCQIIFRVVFQAPRNWQDRFPMGKFRTLDGTIAEPSISDDVYWAEAKACLEIFVRQLRMLDSSDHILGVHLERGEWFLTNGTGYDNSPAAQLKFRDWARTRYFNDVVTLRASWFDGLVNFDNLRVPEFEPEGAEGEKFVRSSRKQRRFVDYHLFLSDVTVARLGELAEVAKDASDGCFLVGASYGYTFEWSHPSSGHLALGKLLRMEDIDFIAGPPSYRNREPGGTGPFPGPIDSFALNGKLYISEEDFKTSLSTGHEPDDFNVALKTPQALDSAHWRGAGAALAHGSGLAWMDLWGNGWLKSHGVWERAAKIRQALIERVEVPLGDPDVAVFIDERALAYLVDPNAFDLLVQNVREAVLRAGVSAAFYLLSDLAHREKFPESKAYIFLNAWDVRPDLRAAIKSRLHRDDKVLLWLYSAGLFDGGRDSLERVREITGIALKPQPFYSKPGTTILNKRHPLSQAFADSVLVGSSQLEPSYFAIPEGATVLGEYRQTGLPSFVVKQFDEDPQARWTSVFLGEPMVNAGLVRALAQMAGAHVWNFHEDVTHVRAPFCTVHCKDAGTRNLTLPDKHVAYSLTTGGWYGLDAPNVRFAALEGLTHSFLVGPKTEIEHLLATNETKALIMTDLPPRDANVRKDSSNFDVPIMKLDDWIEGGEPDEIADDWFLRTVAPVEAPAQAEESQEKVGKRRRRRRTGKGGRDYEPGPASDERGAPAYSLDDGIDMSVMFRKRD